LKMYRVSGKQLALLAALTAVITAMILSLVQRAAVERRPIGEMVEPTVIADPSVATEEQNNIQIYHSVSPGVVNITNRGYTRNFWGIYPSEGSGSGSVIDAEGHILTNYHVIQNARQLEVQIENNKYPATVVGTDRDDDLAVIRVDANRSKLTVVKLGSSTGLEVGQKVLAIGNPFGLQRTMTRGIISGLERPIRDPVSRRTIEGAIQTDASINPGNSGGPLLNDRGEMIGINTMIYSTTGSQQTAGSIGIGFAVPVDLAKKVIPTLIQKGYVPRAWLGISAMPLSANIVQAFELQVSEGMLIGDVYRGTGGAAAGLRGAVIAESFWGGATLQQIGDIIVSVDGQPVRSTDEFDHVFDNKKAGDVVRVEIYRDGRKITLPVRLTEHPRDE
jgi:putative serine protease PepD